MEDVLILRDLSLDEPSPPDVNVVEKAVWLKNQKYALATIRLTCEPDVAAMIADATTGKQAWDILSSTYASTNSTNVMRLEDDFNSARKLDQQSMSQWIARVKSLVTQLRGVGVMVPPEKVANRILNGLGDKFDPMKYALQARSGALTVEIVTEDLLSWETSAARLTLPPASIPPPAIPYYVASVPSQNNAHRGPMATAMSMNPVTAPPLTCSCTCAVHSHAVPTAPGPARHPVPVSSQRFTPYPTTIPVPSSPPLVCHACGRLGHTQNRCWVRFPQLRPQWMRDIVAGSPATPAPTAPSRPQLHLAQDVHSLVHLEQDALGPDPAAFSLDSYNFSGPDTPAEPPADTSHAFMLHHHLANRSSFSNEYCFTLRDHPRLLSQRVVGSLHPDDEPGKWLVDSGASSHFSPFRHLFLSLERIEPPVKILTGNGYVLAGFKGPIPLIIKVDDRIDLLHLEDVLYVPSLQSRVNLYSIVVLADKGIHSTFGPHHVRFTTAEGVLLAAGTRYGNSWWLTADIHSHRVCHSLHPSVSAQHAHLAIVPQPELRWHQRLGHLNSQDMFRLQLMSNGIHFGTPPVSAPNAAAACVGCLVGKQHRTVSYIPRTLPDRKLACIHIDISGPMQVPGYVAGHRYLSVMVDESTRFTHSYCLVSKDAIRECLVEFIAEAERQTGNRVLAIFSDNEAALLQGEFQVWLRARGIKHYTTQTYSPEMNGIAENAIKQIVARGSTMMWAPRMPIGFWPEALRCATYLKNRSPHSALGCTPFEAYFGRKPDLSHLRIFGSRCYAHVPKEQRQKLDSHTIECVFMGYYPTERLYAVYDVTSRQILKKRDVIFYEHILGHPSLSQWGLAPGTDVLGATIPLPEVPNDANDVVPPATTSTPSVPPVNAQPVALLASVSVPPVNTQPIALLASVSDPTVLVRHMALDPPIQSLPLRSRSSFIASPKTSSDAIDLVSRYTAHYRTLCTQYGITLPLNLADAIDEPDPTSWPDAMHSRNRNFWLQAAYDEMCQIARMNTFVFTNHLPPGRSALPAKWVWKTKRSTDSTIVRFKARWVVRGDLQKKGIDYTDTFAPVAQLVSLRLLFTIVAIRDLELDQLDAVSAFLNGDVDTEIFLRQPQGFVLDSALCALRRSLYGLCQAARAWYTVLDRALASIQFFRLMTDMAVWVRCPGDTPSSISFVAAHVDDLVCGGSRLVVDSVKAHLLQRFNMRDLGPASVFVGLKLLRDRSQRTIHLDQCHYAREILEMHGMADCNPSLLPMSPSDLRSLTKSQSATDTLSEVDKRRYQSILGSLGYLVNCTRPDLAFSVNRLAQFAHRPTDRHLIAVKRVLRYLRYTSDSTLLLAAPPDQVSLSHTSDSTLVSLAHPVRVDAWFDASWADDPDDRRSTFGYVVRYGNACLIWKSRKHRMVSLSTTDAEYVAASEVTRELSSIRNLFDELQIPFPVPVPIHGDNFNANSLANAITSSNRTRHIAIRERYVTEQATEGVVRAVKVDSSSQFADIFTKPLSRDLFVKHATGLGLTFARNASGVALICSTSCVLCRSDFPSLTQLHRHLRRSHGALFFCLLFQFLFLLSILLLIYFHFYFY